MLQKLFHVLARSDIFFYSILWLMALLIIGTITEQQQGLYYAQQTYFSVYYFWLFNIIPLPGTYTILTIIFINLLFKLGTDKWQIKKLGTLVTHISGLLLLLGGFLTAHYSQEGYMDITENSSINYFSDYYKTELVINNNKNNNKQIFTQDQLKPNQLLNNNLPFVLKITDYCKHCELKNNTLIALPTPKDNEQPNIILGIKIQNCQNITDTIYLIHDDNLKPYTYSINNTNYYFHFRHKRTYLPFAIKLNKFTETLHPGTNIAKEYSSDVMLLDKNNQINWHGTISMNQPLRYKGYTFYQSSFYKTNNQYTTVLASVYNIGQNFPYITSILLCIGLLLHLLQRLPKLFKLI